MFYTKVSFGKELKKRLLQQYTVAQIAEWVKDRYQNQNEIIDRDFDFLELLIRLSVLDGSHEDEFDREDLFEIAELLLIGEMIDL
ncbi:hypothetical protein HYV11_02940 [Candidatus Dependentiae bacterium]|nr:hypothetical protein [Candidatus Dependentiae bacterium]